MDRAAEVRRRMVGNAPRNAGRTMGRDTEQRHGMPSGTSTLLRKTAYGVLFEGWNKGWENWGGNQQFDYLEPYADFDLERIAAYARKRACNCGCTMKREEIF